MYIHLVRKVKDKDLFTKLIPQEPLVVKFEIAKVNHPRCYWIKWCKSILVVRFLLIVARPVHGGAVRGKNIAISKIISKAGTRGTVLLVD